MDHSYWHTLISGKATGIRPFVLRRLLAVAAFGYSMAIRTRLFLYKSKILTSARAPLPVISVGNLTVGGTGKTPFVEMVARHLLAQGLTPALISRGYHPLPGQKVNDEALLLAENLPQVPHLLGSNRVEMARLAWEKYKPDCIILDDGYQHLKIDRDLNILLIDSLCPFGYGKLVPAGLLREPLSQIKRAHLIGLTKCNQQTEDELERLEEILGKYSSAPCFRVGLEVGDLVGCFGDKKNSSSLEISQLQQKKGYAFCGLANPLSFQKTLGQLKIPLVEFRPFSDHHHYTESDMEGICRSAKSLGAHFLITTQKDGVKLQPRDLPLIVLKIRAKLLKGGEHLERALGFLTE